MSTKIKITLKKTNEQVPPIIKTTKVDKVKGDEMIDRYIPLLLERYIENVQLFESINKKLMNNKKLRNDNFPSHISENIIKFAIT